MLFFIGLGLHGARGLSLLGLDLAKRSEIVYLDTYTSPIVKDEIDSLKGLIGNKILTVGREFIEDGREIIHQAGKKDVSLVASGDPMVATTHMELRLRAERSGVKTLVIHGPSILCALTGETGLHAYNFGRPVTLMRTGASRSTVYEVIHENLARGLHTALLLEYDQASGFSLNPREAIQSLLQMEEDNRQDIIDDDTLLIVASRIGSSFQSISGGNLAGLVHKDYGEPPHLLIVPGRLHFTEIDALRILLNIDEGKIKDNSLRAQRLAIAMVRRYLLSTRRALSRAVERGKAEKKHLDDLFENVECYLSDSERFLNAGKYELAVLSVGYAEGLLDSLRLTKELEVEW
ncbi:MAG: diphthine synthase [Nitrososphaerales archaeon]